jgi:hypothetical protein
MLATSISKIFGMKWNVLFYPVLLLIVLACSSSSYNGCPDTSCDDYITQPEAQAAFDADRECLGELDNDNDGIACEHLPAVGGGTGCPTIGNCGCSNKNKDQCASACCQWIVGTGCKCR